ncbi:hypothetical protein QBC37DRAFT_120305 [Rhypophila decipiens]|uniref:Uncharacterized protein n=1 Tax=Rhypophila decipiens TaxID=261697 RepID=A0AAN6YGF0_9PEZI|nr:hypothetical protein QBC37DRAFT_120305 [Rhypophila decipiens]
MEAEEQTLRRTCEEPRLREEQSSKQLAVANQLYQKLKLQYTQGGSSPSLAHARQPAQLRRDVDPLPNPEPYGQRAPEPQFLGSGQERLERAKYFSAATAPYPRAQPSQGQFVGGAWNKSATTQYTPTRRLPTLNPRNSRHSLNPEQTVPSTGRSSSRFQAAPSPSTTQGMSNLGRIPEVPKPNFGRGPLEPGILGAPSGRSGHQRVDTLASQLGPRPPSRSYGPAHGSMHRH